MLNILVSAEVGQKSSILFVIGTMVCIGAQCIAVAIEEAVNFSIVFTNSIQLKLCKVHL